MQTDANYDFDATIALTNGSTVTARARAMLDAGSYSLWTSGQVAQTIILTDHTNATTCNGHPCGAYDMGLGTYASDKPFRPIFHATFWPTINKVKLRYVGEIANTEALADQTYSVSLTAGKASPATVYTQSSLTHGAAKRWTVSLGNIANWTVSTPGGNITVPKEIWIGGTPPPIQINHNLAYLASTKAVYNYDTSFSVPEATIASIYTGWTANTPSNAIIGGGNAGSGCGSYGLCGLMGTAGGRLDIGPFDGWSTQYLYTFDPRSQKEVMRNAEVAGWWPLHWREGKSAKKITRTALLGCTYQCDQGGIGKIMSVTSRPTIYTSNLTFSGIATADKVIPISKATDSAWVYDSTHVQEYQTVPYIVTGDYWYLEELQFLAANVVAAGYQSPYSRWPNGYNHVIEVATWVRAMWQLRTRAHAAYFSPDDTVEKSYFEVGINDNQAFQEGERGLTGSSLYNDSYFRTSWDAGAATHLEIPSSPGGVPTTHFWDYGNSVCDDATIDCTNVYATGSPWMLYYAIISVGRAKELGYPADKLLTYSAYWLNSMLTDSSFNPWLVGKYRQVVTQNSPRAYYTFAQVKAKYSDGNRTTFDTPDYARYAFAASSFVKGEANGSAAWTWLNTNSRNGVNHNLMESDPSWTILPRNAVALVPSACDLNADGRVDALDVQSAVEQALGMSPCTNADLEGSGNCTVVGVQRVINAALGGSCRVGL